MWVEIAAFFSERTNQDCKDKMRNLLKKAQSQPTQAVVDESEVPDPLLAEPDINAPRNVAPVNRSSASISATPYSNFVAAQAASKKYLKVIKL